LRCESDGVQNSTGQPRRVLVVDRDARVRAALAALIDATPGLEVAAATGSLADVGRIARMVAATVAVVDVDAARPDDDLAIINDLARCLPVVAVCAASSAGGRAVAAGASAFCDKDGDADCLMAAVVAAAQRPRRPADR
jgi:DNA-binding NarL/FixJ family response regulator